MKKAVVFLLLLSVLFLSGCADGGRPCADLLSDFCREYGELTDALRYCAGAEEWEGEAMPADMADILFAEDNGENAFSLCTDYAILLLPDATGGEIAFLRAGSRADAALLSEMCLSRLSRMLRTLPNAPVLTGACVMRRGRTVVLLMLPDNERAKSICHGLL